MKNLIKSILTFSFLIVACSFVKADPTSTSKPMNYTLTKFIEGTTLGEIAGLPVLLDDGFKMDINCGTRTFSFNKKQVVEFMKNTKNIVQNCSTTYKVVEQNEDVTIAKVEMKYPNFTRVNYVTLVNHGAYWSITNVSSSYI
jgi:hypothetical protein